MLSVSGAELAQAWKPPHFSKIKQAKMRQISACKPNINTIKTKIQNPNLQIPRSIQALANPIRLVPAADAPIRASVLPLQEIWPTMYNEPPFTASSFVIEEEFEGQKHLWGVTAAHIAELLGTSSAVLLNGIPFPVRFTAQGTSGMTDLALFPLDDMAGLFIPLKLAEDMPKVGEKTFSFGFFDEGFYLVPNRTVKEKTPNRMITSLEFQTTARGGACGGPVLNARGEVTGVHIGSSDSKQISFVVPAAEIKRLLHAYRHQGKALKTLVFNGVEIGPININEHIEEVYSITGGQATQEFTARHREKEIDYGHLETLVQSADPDQVQFFITHKPFSDADQDALYGIRLTYDLRSHQITRAQIPASSLKTRAGKPGPRHKK